MENQKAETPVALSLAERHALSAISTSIVDLERTAGQILDEIRCRLGLGEGQKLSYSRNTGEVKVIG